MSKTNNGFSYTDGIDLRDLFDVQIKNIQNLIDANDKNYNQRFENVVESTRNALNTADRAVNKAEMATEKRFESVNEFRATLSDQASTFIIRTEFDLVVDRLEQDIKNLLVARAEMATVKNAEMSHSALQMQIDELKLTNARLEGKASQESVEEVSRRVMIGYIFSTLGALIAIISLIIKFI